MYGERMRFGCLLNVISHVYPSVKECWAGHQGQGWPR